MKKIAKRCLLVMLVLLTLVIGPFTYVKKTEAAATYNNTGAAGMNVAINTNGELEVPMYVSGIKGRTTRIETSLYVEKRILGIFWHRVDIGCTDNVWHDSVTGYYYSNMFTHDLNTTGTYRVTVTFTVSGSGGSDDVITIRDTATY